MAKAYRRSPKAREERATKVTVSIPGELLTAVETSARGLGRPRSAIFQEALRFWLGEEERAMLTREYAAGYGRDPEDAGDAKASEMAAARLLADEDW